MVFEREGRTLPRLALAGLLLAAATAARANDSVAELGTGGLELARNDAVAMASEDLFISPDAVRVAYVFKNGSERDVDALVAFPMPELKGDPYGIPALPLQADDNFLGFHVAIDGKPAAPKLEQRAFALGLDVSDALREAGVPLYPYGEAALAALARLPQAVADDWTARGIIFVDSYDDGSGWKNVRTPFWGLRSTYWWRSVFPAGREVRVTHDYKPSVGGTIGTTFYWDGKFQGQYDDYRRRYCFDKAFEAAVRKAAVTRADGNPALTEMRIRYVLTTGSNWAGGSIGKFHLTVDKGDPRNLLSFCATDLRKTGPTTFEVNAADFYPERDLDILILAPFEPGQPEPQRRRPSGPAAGQRR